MLVFRIEHNSNGMGPYRPDAPWSYTLGERLRSDHMDDDTRPTPDLDSFVGEDRRRFITENEVCGLDSLDSLCVWFDGWLDTLGQHGFVCCVYETTKARISVFSGQVTFDKDDATLMDIISL